MSWVLNYKPLPKQALFHRSLARYRAYAGGFGSGKTLCGAAEAIQLSFEYPLNFGLVGRMTYPELRDTTWKEVLEFPILIDGKELPLVASPLVKSYNKSEHSLEFVNGSVMIARSLEQAFHKIKSLNLGWYWIDEGTEANEEIWLGLAGRLRRKGVRHTGFLTTNPEGHDWVWKRFIAQSDERHSIVLAPSTENKYLPEGYVQSLIDQYPEEWTKRYVYCSFDTFEGLVYKDFQDKEPFVVPDNSALPDSWYRFVGLDHGYRNPTAVLWGAVSPDGVLYVYDEFFASGKLVSEVSEIVKTKTGGKDIRLWLIDPSCRNRDAKTGRSIVDEFSDNGLYFEGANNDVRAGINHVNEYLKLTNGKPKLRIFQRCVNLRTELQTYKWKDLKVGAIQDAPEKPVKRDDHAVDALRYMVNYVYDTPLKHAKSKRWQWKDYLPKHRTRQNTDWMAA